MDHHGLYQAVGRIEGSLEAFRDESRRQSQAIVRRLDEGHRVMHWHDKRLTALEQQKHSPAPQDAPQAPSLRPEVVEILKVIAPAGGWVPWLVLAVLALTGNVKPELVRDYVLGLPPAASSVPGSE